MVRIRFCVPIQWIRDFTRPFLQKIGRRSMSDAYGRERFVLLSDCWATNEVFSFRLLMNIWGSVHNLPRERFYMVVVLFSLKMFAPAKIWNNCTIRFRASWSESWRGRKELSQFPPDHQHMCHVSSTKTKLRQVCSLSETLSLKLRYSVTCIKWPQLDSRDNCS